MGSIRSGCMISWWRIARACKQEINERDMKYQVFSVESRKGGVGKTTMALNLSKALIDKGYKVLLIDCDMSGTSMASAVEQSCYWSKLVNVFHKEDGHAENLMELYKAQYEEGCTDGAGIIKRMKCAPKKINIISSDIIDEEGQLIIDPRELMDELNTYWLLDLIKDIASSFDKINEMPTAIVIDNSPGFVGIDKAIRNWMSDIGPQFSHFLLVSSIDSQDVKSVIGSAEEIRKSMQAKWDIAHGSFIKEDNRDLLKNDSSIGQFMFSFAGGNKYESASVDEISESRYLSILFNKVPNDVIDEHIEYSLPEFSSPSLLGLQTKLIPLTKGFPDIVVGYDNMISEQFFSSRIVINNRTLSSSSSLKKVISDKYQFAESLRTNNDAWEVSRKLVSSYKSLNSNLRRNGLKSLSQSFKSDISPLHFVTDLAVIISKMANYQICDAADYDSLVDLNIKHISEFVQNQNVTPFSSSLNAIHEIIQAICKKGTSYKIACNRLTNASIALRLLFDIHNNLLNFDENYRTILTEKKQLFSRLIDRNINSFKYDDTFNLLNCWGEINIESLRSMINECFFDFYKKVSYGLVRLHDSIDDFKAVMFAYEMTINNSSRYMHQDLKKYLTRTVIQKKELLNDKMLKDIAEQPFEMTEVQKIIKDKILVNWI